MFKLTQGWIGVLLVSLAGSVSAMESDEIQCLSASKSGLVDLPFPVDAEPLVSVTERLVIPLPVDEAYDRFKLFPLTQFMTGTEDLAGVARTHPLVGQDYLNTGERRAVCLKNGFGAVEELVDATPPGRFAYRVWAYNVPEAQGIEYADGEFLFKPVEQGTEITWNYSFSLKTDRFPGSFGAFGRWLFSKTFLESTWRGYMQLALHNFESSL
ncbi:MAG: SRPBCC family protein [Pseudomonadales bacterium]|nr:SRPBCC family protein [Pseudomonadales bacterium]